MREACWSHLLLESLALRSTKPLSTSPEGGRLAKLLLTLFPGSQRSVPGSDRGLGVCVCVPRLGGRVLSQMLDKATPLRRSPPNPW